MLIHSPEPHNRQVSGNVQLTAMQETLGYTFFPSSVCASCAV